MVCATLVVEVFKFALAITNLMDWARFFWRYVDTLNLGVKIMEKHRFLSSKVKQVLDF